MNRLRLLTFLTLAPLLVVTTEAATLFDQKAVLYSDSTNANNYRRGINWQSSAGVPISSTAGNPKGSNGKAPAGSTRRQFQGGIVYGAVSYRTITGNVTLSRSFPQNAKNLGWPHSENADDSIKTVLRMQASAPYMMRVISFYFGSVISPPEIDINGNKLSESEKKSYWDAEPVGDPVNGHKDAPYYWSPHANQLYATEPGRIAVTWRRATPESTTPTSNLSSFKNIGNNYYRLFPTNYIVSGAAFKTPRKMYWTQGKYSDIGKPVLIPTARVGDVKVVYNSTTFPEFVGREKAIYESSEPFITNLTDRTLWYDTTATKQILARNIEGRVFVELLGDIRTGTDRNQLGYEIVDVFRQASPADVAIELGEKILPPQTFVTNLFPEPLNTAAAQTFAFQNNVAGSDTIELYATRETKNQNDYQVFWMEESIAGLRWPFVLARYDLKWPKDAAKYSHYVRPQSTKETGKETAVPLPTDNVPSIEYQDLLDQPRALLTEDLKFYTFLDVTYPAHRTLLRFTVGDGIAFERVFSWLDVSLRTPAANTNFAGSVAVNLTNWNSASRTLDFPNALKAPRVVAENVWMGQRLAAPSEELHTNTAGIYVPGYIRQSEGTGYSVSAYKDPFVFGFEEAAKGSIIPVNAGPDSSPKTLEVWWYRTNGANLAKGFKSIYWPAVIGKYSVRWPTEAGSEIILASNAGSGPLTSLEEKGTIYVQNDRTQPGYNPNEEHALMSGGQAYALRDDLNVTSTVGYSSHPFVLVEYTDRDSRPSMRVFQVLREKGNTTFNYTIDAGTVLQPPMPLQVMEKPLGPKFIGSEPRSLNHELYFRTVKSSTADGDLITHETHHFRPFFRELALQSPNRSATNWYFVTNVSYADKLLKGVVSRSPARPITPSTNQPNPISNLTLTTAALQNDFYSLTATRVVRFVVPDDLTGISAGATVYAIAPAVGRSWAMSALSVDKTGSTIDLGITSTATTLTSIIELTTASASVTSAAATLLQGLPGTNDLLQATLLFVPSGSITANQFADWTLRARPVSAGGSVKEDPFLLQDRKGNLWVYRGPHQTGDTPYTQMQFYYKTLPGFFFPKNIQGTLLDVKDQPPVGTITPYLRNLDSNGTYLGDPIYGSSDNGVTDNNNAFEVAYVPKWPDKVPVLQMAETLTVPKHGLPAVRGQTSLQIVYQQSAASDTNNISVRLHDPTREKEFKLGPKAGTAILGKIPDSVKTETLRGGKTYFPLLPPHLVQRFFFDPDRGANGALVFKGEYVPAPVGESYLLLNVLSQKDMTTLQNLCVNSDRSAFNRWTAAIAGLQTVMPTWVEDPQKPGTYIPAEGAPSIGPSDIAEVTNSDVEKDSYALTAVGPGTGYVTLIAGNGLARTPRADPVTVLVIKVTDVLYPGEVKIILPPNPLNELLTLQQVVDLAGKTENFAFQWRIAAPVGGLPPTMNRTNDNPGAQWLPLAPAKYADGLRAIVGESADVQALADNYLIMRYRATGAGYSPGSTNWSAWTDPQLAEGWIKRVVAGINPFNQRVTDLFNNRVNTDVSILTQAGARWEGDVALNADSINDAGLIEIYETVLNRGRMLSINSGINYGPANDALLLVAGYLNDLYMMLGNEAWADAANPTIGIGTKDRTYGDIATALFAFKAQTASLLEEELALLRGRDDFLAPGVETRPVYNRLFWNYTRGIDAGEVIYALNYNIQENNDTGLNGVIDADDARKMFPQGHGDAYGHYLTALKGYYALLMDTDFDWVPRIEAVTVLGKPVSVDYQDERKFAAAAAAVARAGRQVVDLTWRKDFVPGDDAGWEHFGTNRVNTSRQQRVTRFWGLDHWASRTVEGAYINWAMGNSILPAVDDNPEHEGIQKVDRTTVPELKELTATAEDLQTALDNAEAHLTPLGLANGSLAFDINPSKVTGANAETHFEQVYGRAKVALNNALAAFDDAKDVTRLMRSEQDSLAELQTAVAKQELAYTNALVELYGTPYPDDIGPGGTYAQGYQGPDLEHYAYVDNVEMTFPALLEPMKPIEYKLDVQTRPSSFLAGDKDRFDFYVPGMSAGYESNKHYVIIHLDNHGFFQKPIQWKSRRASPGKLQEAVSRIILNRNALQRSLVDHDDLRYKLGRQIELLSAKTDLDRRLHAWDKEKAIVTTTLESTLFALKMAKLAYDTFKQTAEDYARSAVESIPKETIVGLANGGDILSGARGAIYAAAATSKAANTPLQFAKEFLVGSLQVSRESFMRHQEAEVIGPLTRKLEDQHLVFEIDMTLSDLQTSLFPINQRLQELESSIRNYKTLEADGNRIRQEREVFRQRSAAVVQGFRTRDAAFRIFRNEKLERYKTLFDLAARYAYLSATAYDYETGLLNTKQGRQFINRIVNARALGVVRNGEPQYAASNTGDPGLSSALAEMKADFDVLKGRLGFNNSSSYGTTVSLRREKERIIGANDANLSWQDVLQHARRDNLLDDEHVRRYCMQIDRGNGLTVPGIVLEFSTTVEDGLNLFGRDLAGGDHYFDSSLFATKIFGIGVAFEGYVGMDNPVANTGAVNGAGGYSPPDPNTTFIGAQALAATPGIYLIPVGVDAMRSPPLGDASQIRSWSVNDVTIPLPFNIGGSDLSTKQLWQSSESLSEPLFNIRKHAAFRPVSTTAAFSSAIYAGGGNLQLSQFTNTRLIGRSVWNTKWKLVIPGHKLLSDPLEGLDRFIQTVKDIKLHFVTYSYAGN